jgi:hypothetical protein
VLNDLDRFPLVLDAIDRLPQTGDKGIDLKEQLRDKLIEHKQYIDKNGEDLPKIRNWRWGGTKQSTRKEPISRQEAVTLSPLPPGLQQLHRSLILTS